MKHTTIHITGMHCKSCVMLLTDMLTDIEGVKEVSVKIGTAEVDYDPATVTEADLRKAVDAEGYKAT